MCVCVCRQYMRHIHLRVTYKSVCVCVPSENGCKHNVYVIKILTTAYQAKRIKRFAFESAARKQCRPIFPSADVCTSYEIFPKRPTLNGKIGSRSCLRGQHALLSPHVDPHVHKRASIKHISRSSPHINAHTRMAAAAHRRRRQCGEPCLGISRRA